MPLEICIAVKYDERLSFSQAEAGAKSTVGLLLYALKNGFLNIVSSRENAFA